MKPMEPDETAQEEPGVAAAPRAPGVIVVFVDTAPAFQVHELTGPIRIGRKPGVAVHVDDAMVSREHAEILRDGVDVIVRDLGSRNGTHVDGEEVPRAFAGRPRVIRTGSTLLLYVDDVRPYREAAVEEQGEMVVGPALAKAVDAIRAAAHDSAAVHIEGESGAGKELLARVFHAAGPRPDGPFVAVNCAAIPEGVAERLLFGAKRGAYSGATTDAEGYIVAAAGGTLFLDEVAELDPSVQAKLLRVVETQEVTPLGATQARAVDFRTASASNVDLREAAGAGRFRLDLYYRLSHRQVRLPPLRDRAEEIPWLIARELGKRKGLVPHARFVETCLIRPWPGNVRELLSAVGAAAGKAVADGRHVVAIEDLDPHAGRALAAAAPPGGEPDREILASTLRDSRWNISAAARALGVHRTQLARWIKRHGLQRP